MGKMPRSLSSVWSQEAGLSLLLCLLTILIFVIYPTSPTGMANRLGVAVYALLLASGVTVAGGIHRWAGRTNALLAAAWIGVELLMAIRPSQGMLIAEACVALPSLLLLEVTVLVQVFSRGIINGHRIRGAVAVYLLLGLSWAWIYRLSLLLAPGAIVTANTPGQNLLAGTHLIYFSFTTLTTVGYGDIVPVHAVVRSLANLEALIGQLYPVILIGRLISPGGGPDRQ
jgi:hypothetical protein